MLYSFQLHRVTVEAMFGECFGIQGFECHADKAGSVIIGPKGWNDSSSAQRALGRNVMSVGESESLIEYRIGYNADPSVRCGESFV